LALVVGNGQFMQTLSSHIRQIVKRSSSEVSCLASSSSRTRLTDGLWRS